MHRTGDEDSGEGENPEIDERDQNADGNAGSRATRNQIGNNVAFPLDARR
ncbi:MAG TPA: hypothetical protein VLV50_05040 [Stellaceae bacterium]|nr:hypothetical protein [Stellaceae bacterium]